MNLEHFIIKANKLLTIFYGGKKKELFLQLFSKTSSIFMKYCEHQVVIKGHEF
jgi:hypothetical protein